MVTVGNLIRATIKPGKEAEFERFLRDSLPAIQGAPDTIAWFAFRLGPNTYGVFDTFTNNDARLAHLQAAFATQREKAPDLLASDPVIEVVDILAAKL
jgi:quinol monooxygenase YgiN